MNTEIIGNLADVEFSDYGFGFIPTSHGWKVMDQDSFNNWGTIQRLFSTLDEAVDYAFRCSEFKKGRRSTV